jgi:hypothetical protein
VALNFVDGEMSFGVFGLKYNGTSVWHPIPLLVTSILTFAGVVAYGLLWGKDWAINAGVVYGILGFSMSIISTIHSISSGNIHISMEPFMLIAFVVALLRRRQEWNNYNSMITSVDTLVEHVPPAGRGEAPRP